MHPDVFDKRQLPRIVFGASQMTSALYFEEVLVTIAWHKVCFYCCYTGTMPNTDLIFNSMNADVWSTEGVMCHPYAVVFFMVHNPFSMLSSPPNLFGPKDGLIQIKLKKVSTDNPGVFQLLWRHGVKPAASGPPRHSKPTSCSALSGSWSRAAPLLANLGKCECVHMWSGTRMW